MTSRLLWSFFGTQLMVALLLGTSGCTTSPEPVVMPPSPPTETIQSSVFPATPTPLPPPSLHDGIQLTLAGNPVDYETLAPASADEDPQTILVQVDPSTRYADVEQVLERLHDLGYLIAFKSGNTP